MSKREMTLAGLWRMATSVCLIFASLDAQAECRHLADYLKKLSDPRNAPPPAIAVSGDAPRLRTVADLVGEGYSLDAAFELKHVPKERRSLYDSQTGRFTFNSPKPFALSVENGDERLLNIRMNWTAKNYALSKEQFKSLTEAMRQMPGARLLILSGMSEIEFVKKTIDKLPKEIRKKITLGEAGYVVELWSQDGSKPLVSASGESTLLPASVGNKRYEFSILAAEINGSLKTSRTNFSFEGGNIVVGAKNVFVGPKIVDEAMGMFGLTRTEAIEALSNEFGKPVLEIGFDSLQGKVPIDFHIDLTMAIVRNRKSGKEVVLLESPRKAFEVLLGGKEAGALSADPRAFYDQLIRGQLKTGSQKVRTVGERNLEDLLERTDPDVFATRERQVQQVAEQLRRQGYDVVFVPGFNTNPKKATKTPRYFNYTNSIFSGDHALIPEMGVRVWDEYFQKQLEDMGYSHTSFPVVQKSLCQKGGIRCLTETYRYPPGRP